MNERSPHHRGAGVVADCALAAGDPSPVLLVRWRARLAALR